MLSNQSNRFRAAVWSAIGTIALLPVASALFIFLFDRGAPINLQIAFTFPYLIYRYQGFLVGSIVNGGILAFTFVPLFVLLRSTEFRDEQPAPLAEQVQSEKGVRPHSIPARVLAALDFILGTVFAMIAIDYPLISLAIMVPMYAAAYGLFATKPWGWYFAMLVHALIMVALLVGYSGIAIMALQNMGRPRGHMELISSEAALVIATIALVLLQVIAGIPILLLRRKGVLRKFFPEGNAAME